MRSLYGFYDKIENHLANNNVRAFHYVTSVALVLAVTVLRLALGPVIGEGYVFIFFYPAVILAGWFGGLKPGLLATILSALIADLLFLSPAGSTGVSGRNPLPPSSASPVLG